LRVAGVVGVILGAGSSRRLGRPKQTLPLGDTTLLGWVLREAEASSLDRVVVVTQDEVATARSEVAQPEAGGDETCSNSLRSGLAAAGPCEAVMLLLGDMPGVDAAVIDSVRVAWESKRDWAMVTRYDDGLGHPLVFAADAFPALRALHGDKAVWKLLESQPDSVGEVRVVRSLPRDVDTWDDYQAVLRALV
jgi:molybdenum cofactor cytidylyltransferase